MRRAYRLCSAANVRIVVVKTAVATRVDGCVNEPSQPYWVETLDNSLAAFAADFCRLVALSSTFSFKSESLPVISDALSDSFDVLVDEDHRLGHGMTMSLWSVHARSDLGLNMRCKALM